LKRVLSLRIRLLIKLRAFLGDFQRMNCCASCLKLKLMALFLLKRLAAMLSIAEDPESKMFRISKWRLKKPGV